MNWMMRAISAPCRIASPRLQSEERRLISSRSKGFQPQPSVRRMRHSPTPREFPTRASVRAPNDRAGFANRQDRQGNRFPDRVLRSDRPFAERTEGYRDNRHGRDGRPRDFRPYRDSPTQATREGGADVAASSGLPPFITASPRPTNADPTKTAPSPDAVASPAPIETPEAGPAVFEQPSGESGFPARAGAGGYDRHMDLRGGDSGESGGPNSTPEITDDSPVTE